MSTTKQDNDFRDTLVSTRLLEEAIDWIRSNMKPDDVFEEKELIAYASNFDPEDVFTESSLENWADKNGWTKE